MIPSLCRIQDASKTGRSPSLSAHLRVTCPLLLSHCSHHISAPYWLQASSGPIFLSCFLLCSSLTPHPCPWSPGLLYKWYLREEEPEDGMPRNLISLGLLLHAQRSRLRCSSSSCCPMLWLLCPERLGKWQIDACHTAAPATARPPCDRSWAAPRPADGR